MPRIPRDIQGRELAQRLKGFGYSVTRQTGSHMRLTSSYMGTEHHVTIPSHDNLRIGTINSVLADVAHYLHMEKAVLAEKIFGKQ